MKELVCLKSIIKKSNTIEFVARVVFQMIPVTFREKLSLESNEPYSLLEDKHKFIFVHIPKCAGNAVIGSLFNEKSTGHIPIFKYKKADPKKYKSYIKISVVRNPESRFVSAFEYLKQGGMGTYDREFFKKYLSAYETADELAFEMNKNKNFKDLIMSWTHFKPQACYLLIDGELGVDYIFRQENLERDFDKLQVILNQKKEGRCLKKINSSTSKDKKMKSKKARKIIKDFYSKDYEILGYE